MLTSGGPGARNGAAIPTKPVCLIQRHLSSAQRWTVTSSIISQFCHWVVLVCDETWTPERIQGLIADLNNNTVVKSESLGFTLERSRRGDSGSCSTMNGMSVVTTELFKLEEYTECIFSCVGTSELTEEEICHRGTLSGSRFALIAAWRILRESPNYQPLSNNCQDWARMVVESISSDANCPRTIGECCYLRN
jgi:hypothetical protein